MSEPTSVPQEFGEARVPGPEPGPTPGADAGHLWIFEGLNQSASALGTYEPVGGVNGIASTYGIVIYANATAATIFDVNGTWAVRGS